MDRIDQLIKQATHDCMGVDVLDRREFAQLIIQECSKFTDHAEELYKHFDIKQPTIDV